MRVLIALTYYRPHVSGLTIYVERLARELAARGHEVTVLTTRHDPILPAEEVVDGVRVVRVPVWFRVSKGVVTPLALRAAREVRRHDAVSIHLPQLEGGAVAALARLARRRTVVTHHCDLRLPRGLVNRVADAVTHAMNLLAGACAHAVVAYTQDYAAHSPLLRRVRRKIAIVLPPVEVAAPDPERVAALRRGWGAGEGPVIGMAARLATEKGVEHVVAALPELLEEHPDARVVFAGPHEGIVGEEDYRARLAPAIEALGERWRFVGVLDQGQMADFLAAIDVLVVSSTNRTESFGLVQVEAMLCGTPVVATDLPGVREPVRATGMGVVVRPGDPGEIAGGVREVWRAPERFVVPRDEIARRFDLGATVDAYERLLGDQRSDRGDRIARQFATMAPHRAVLRSVESRVMEQVELRGPVLDLGTGDGHFAQHTYRAPLDVGVDLGHDEIAEARDRGRGVYRTLAQADAAALPFATGAFSTVVSNCAIEHMVDIDAVVAEIARVLRRGGTFAATLPSERFEELLGGATALRALGLRRAAAAYGRFFDRISYHEHVDPPTVWQQRFATAGLDLVEHQYYFSSRAHRAFDASHYLGVGNLVSRKLTGRWVPHPAVGRAFERWLRRYAEEPVPQPTGAYQFVRAVRVDEEGGGPA